MCQINYIYVVLMYRFTLYDWLIRGYFSFGLLSPPSCSLVWTLYNLINNNLVLYCLRWVVWMYLASMILLRNFQKFNTVPKNWILFIFYCKIENVSNMPKKGGGWKGFTDSQNFPLFLQIQGFCQFACLFSKQLACQMNEPCGLYCT